VAAWACSTHRQPNLVNVNARPKAASLVDARVVHRGDRILRIEASHYRPGLPAFVWTRARNTAVRAQRRRHDHDRCGRYTRTGGYVAKCVSALLSPNGTDRAENVTHGALSVCMRLGKFPSLLSMV